MSAPGTRAAPRAFTLVELLVAVTLLAVALGAIVGVTAGQQRAHAALAARHAARVHVTDAATVLARELRGLAVGTAQEPGDLRELTDSSVELIAVTGASVACGAEGWTLELPRADGPGAATLTWWTAQPRAGDRVMVHDVGPDPSDADDRWREYAVADVGTSVTACAGSPFARGAAAAGGVRVTLDGPAPLPATVGAGTPVRFGRRRRWVHYRAGDGMWYVGVREWDGSVWDETQPVAGPVRSRGAPAGLSFEALDSTGAVVSWPAPVTSVAAVRVVVRATPRVGALRRASRVPAESAAALVAPRGDARGWP